MAAFCPLCPFHLWSCAAGRATCRLEPGPCCVQLTFIIHTKYEELTRTGDSRMSLDYFFLGDLLGALMVVVVGGCGCQLEINVIIVFFLNLGYCRKEKIGLE